MDGALMEVGPFRLHHDQEHLEINNGSWHKHANLLFVDQPVGTGLSTTDTDGYLKELPEMAHDMIVFLEKYFEIFPERQTDEFYIAGESFAGQYIPYLARAILDKNLNKSSEFMEFTDIPESDKVKRDDRPWIDLKTVLIGNGWINPISHYLTYVPFAYKTGLIQHGSSIAAAVESQQKQCVQWYETHPNDRAGLAVPPCDRILDTLLRELYQNTGLARSDPNACVNIYDIRLRDTYSSCGMNWPPDLEYVTPYLRRDDVLNAIHVPSNRGWKECSGPVGSAFKAKHSTPSIEILPTLIDDQIQVVMFNGDQDLICNHVGNEKLIEDLSWGPPAEYTVGVPPAHPEKRDDDPLPPIQPTVAEVGDVISPFSRGDTGFRLDEQSSDWYVDGEAAGTIQSGRNLTYIKIYNASHMVPFDLPMVAQAMIHHFLSIPGYSTEDLLKKPESSTSVDNVEEVPTADDEKETEGTKDGEENDKSWRPYYKAGAFVLVVCILAALFLGVFVWRNRKLAHSLHDSRQRKNVDKRVRSVHYEDELDDFEAGRLGEDYEDEPEGFFKSILLGLSRWHVPHRAAKSLRLNAVANAVGVGSSRPRRGGLKKSDGKKYQHLGSGPSNLPTVEEMDDGEEGVQLETFHDHPETGGKGKRDSIDSIFDDLDNDAPESSTH